ncbi:MAG: hypothetical protein H6755_08125, partial [Candidatus Omnitrophica bacterium]|nr:hypothetical protein [Candidatus Omnitrophota bacterium]
KGKTEENIYKELRGQPRELTYVKNDLKGKEEFRTKFNKAAKVQTKGVNVKNAEDVIPFDDF